MDIRRAAAHSQRVEQVRRRCPHCGADVELARGERAAVCGACKRPFELLVLASNNANAGARNPIDDSFAPLLPFALAWAGIIALAIFGSIALIFIHRADSRAARARVQKRQTHVAEAIPAPAFESRALVWYEPVPALTVVLADGGSGVAGLFAREDGRVGRVWLGAFDARTLAPAWSVGPLGETAESTLYLHAVASGGALVVTDSRGVARVLDAATGTPRYALPLRARAAGLCASGQGQIWVRFKDAPGAMIDVRAARIVPAPRPSWCPSNANDPPECRDLAQRVQLHAQCGPAADAPGLYGVSPSWTLRAGELLIGVGRDHERGGRAALAAFTKGKLLWRATLPDQSLPLLADVVGDAIYVKSEATAAPFHPTLSAYDARTGKLRWSTELPREEHVPAPWITAADGRVFVATEGQLQVLDARSGALLGTIGD